MMPIESKSSRSRGLLLSVVLLISFASVLAQKQPPSKPINLNVANVKELQELPGVGAVTAQRIIDMRQKSGRFKRVEDLLAIRGMSQKKVDALKPYVTLGSPPATPPARKVSPPAKKTS